MIEINPHYKDMSINTNFIKSQLDESVEEMDIDEQSDADSDDDSPILDAVKQQQSKQDSHSCLAPQDLDEQIVTNDSSEIIVKKSIFHSTW